jgi:MoaA/NifB/PqqE/SkfB family radical SAM enzyme
MKISDEIFNLTFDRRIPLYTTIEVTYRCNLNCVHCYLPLSYRTKKFMSKELLKRTIKELS